MAQAGAGALSDNYPDKTPIHSWVAVMFNKNGIEKKKCIIYLKGIDS